jgi:hypothetical protein
VGVFYLLLGYKLWLLSLIFLGLNFTIRLPFLQADKIFAASINQASICLKKLLSKNQRPFVEDKNE